MLALRRNLGNRNTLCFSGVMDTPATRFVISLMATAVSAAALILLVPSLFESPGPVRLAICGALAVMVIAFGLTAHHWRRALPGPGSR